MQDHWAEAVDAAVNKEYKTLYIKSGNQMKSIWLHSSCPIPENNITVNVHFSPLTEYYTQQI